MAKNNIHILDFEKPLLEMEEKIRELREFSDSRKIDVGEEVDKLQKRARQIQQEIFSHLTAWQRIQLARHPDRPYTRDYLLRVADEFIELHGDRLYRDDAALIGGLARIEEYRVVVLGHQKGRDTNENLRRNFGSPHPEGYRKAHRLMEMADKFRLPLICFIDTPGAYPGIEAEERGQAHAIAQNLRLMMELRIPVVVVIIGEGGSGGALGIGVGDTIWIMENAYYSVISPEGCAAILWKSKDKAPEAAVALKLTSRELLELGVVDGIIPEPLAGAHRDWNGAAENVKKAILKSLHELQGLPPEILLQRRQGKYRRLGVYGTKAE